MQERRRHQRVRFALPPGLVVLGGQRELPASLENLSVSGAMVKLADPPKSGSSLGVALSFPGNSGFETAATVASRVGELLGLRFRPAPLALRHLEELLADAVRKGAGSTASLHDIDGCRVLRVCGGFNSAIDNELRHFIDRVGVDELDVSEVTQVDRELLASLAPEIRAGRLRIRGTSPVFAAAYRALN